MLPPITDLISDADRNDEPRTLLFGNGLSLRAGLPFTSSEINRSAVALEVGPRARDLLHALPDLMPEDALRYLRGYPLTHEASETSEYSLLRNAVARAIAEVHPRNQSRLIDGMLSSIADFFIQFDTLFTTNYDLLAYWVMMTEPARAAITDLFAPYEIHDPDSRWILQYASGHFPSRVPLRYLHGALHLAQKEQIVEKLSRAPSGVSLIHQINQRVRIGELPLIVVEGSALRKLRRIESSHYLYHAYDAIRCITGILITYGWGFNLQDQHLVDAIFRNPKLTEIWIGLHGEPDNESNQEMKARIGRRLAEADRLGISTPARIIYYDADSVPF